MYRSHEDDGTQWCQAAPFGGLQLPRGLVPSRRRQSLAFAALCALQVDVRVDNLIFDGLASCSAVASSCSEEQPDVRTLAGKGYSVSTGIGGRGLPLCVCGGGLGLAAAIMLLEGENVLCHDADAGAPCIGHLHVLHNRLLQAALHGGNHELQQDEGCNESLANLAVLLLDTAKHNHSVSWPMPRQATHAVPRVACAHACIHGCAKERACDAFGPPAGVV